MDDRVLSSAFIMILRLDFPCRSALVSVILLVVSSPIVSAAEATIAVRDLIS